MPKKIIQVLDVKDFKDLNDSCINEAEVKFGFSPAYLVTDKIEFICDTLNKENSRNSLCLDFNRHPLSTKDVSDLAIFLKSNHCPPSISLILTYTSLNGSIDILANAVADGCQAREINLALGGNNLGDEGTIILANALKSRSCPSKISLNLSNNDISDRGFITLKDMLESPSNLKELSLNLLFNPKITTVGSNALIEGLQCRVTKDMLRVMYDFSKHGSNSIAKLGHVLQSDKCPALSLQFGITSLSTIEIGILFNALKTMHSTKPLELDLSEQALAENSFVIILNALQHLQKGTKIRLYLMYNAINTENGARNLADFICANNIQSEIYMDLSENLFGGEQGIRIIHDAIVRNPQILNYLTIQGPTREITDLCRTTPREPIAAEKPKLKQFLKTLTTQLPTFFKRVSPEPRAVEVPQLKQ